MMWEDGDGEELIEEQPALGVLDDPREPLVQVLARDGAAREDVPLVCPDRAEIEVLFQAKSAVVLADGNV